MSANPALPHPRELAFMVARLFPDFVPSADQLMAELPWLTRSTACRYIEDYRKAWRAIASRPGVPA